MAKHLIITSLLLLCSLTSMAQEETPQSSESPKWEIATDVLGWIHYGELPSSIFVRKNFTSKNGKPCAYRFRLGVRANYQDHQSNGSKTINYSFAPYTRLGYEKRRLLSEKLSFIYGLDLHASYTHTFYNEDASSPRKHRIVELGLVPFLGFKQNIGKYFYVSVEATASAIYRGNKSDYEWTTITGNQFSSQVKGQAIHARISPLSVINVGVML